MLRGLMGLSNGWALVAVCADTLRQPSVFLWEDETGEVRHIQQGEGGEQGDPLVLLLFCLAQKTRRWRFSHCLTTCTLRVRIQVAPAKPTEHWRGTRETRQHFHPPRENQGVELRRS